MKKFVCTQPYTLRDFTDAVYPQGSFCLASLLREKDIKINGVRVNKNVELKEGDEVVYYTTPAQESARTHEVVYVDENVLIADKFSGVSSEGLCSELNMSGKFFAVHRLDRNTEGLIVYAVNEEASERLKEAFKAHGVQKTYIAVCKNAFMTDKKTLTGYIKKDASAAKVRVYDSPSSGLLKIVTEYAVKEDWGELALVDIVLHTGRTHQIRAHMAHMGCPVLGDNKYGDEALNGKYSLSRQCLVAKRLKFLSLDGELKYLNGKTFESRFSFKRENFVKGD